MAPLMMALSVVLSAAHADVVTLDNGAQIDGHISHYEHGGDCGIAVDAGDLEGALLVVPCARVVRFERGPEAVAVVPLASPDSAGPPEAVVPMAAPVVPPEAAPVAEAAAAEEPVGEEPVGEEPVVAETVPEPEEVAEPEPEPEPAVVDDTPDEPAVEEEAEPAPTGWRAALPDTIKLPEFARSRK